MASQANKGAAPVCDREPEKVEDGAPDIVAFGASLALVGESLALVGDSLALVGEPGSLVGESGDAGVAVGAGVLVGEEGLVGDAGPKAVSSVPDDSGHDDDDDDDDDDDHNKRVRMMVTCKGDATRQGCGGYFAAGPMVALCRPHSPSQCRTGRGKYSPDIYL